MPRTKKMENDNNAKELLSEDLKAMSESSDAKDSDYMRAKSSIIGKNIKAERLSRNFSVETLAEFLELSISYISLLERGDRCPSLKILYKLCELFGTTPDSMLLDNGNDLRDMETLHVAEGDSAYNKYKVEALKKMLVTLNESELDFVITMVKSLKKVKR